MIDGSLFPASTVTLPGLDELRALSGYRRDLAVMEIEWTLRSLHALHAAIVADVHATCGYLDDAHTSATAWFQAVSNTTRPVAGHTHRIGQMLDELPVIAAACAAGDIGAEHIRLLTQLHANPRCAERMPDAQDVLVGPATSMTVRDFRIVCDRFRNWADPDGTLDDHDINRERRTVKTRFDGDTFTLHAQADALSGSIITDILDAHAEAEYLTDIADRQARYGDDAPNHPLARTAAQRRFDALQQICAKAAGTPQPGVQEPVVNIICDLDTLVDDIHTWTHTPNPNPHCPTKQRTRQTANGHPVTTHDLITAALLGHVRRVILDHNGHVIDYGRKQRLFTGAAKDAVLLDGNWCTHPGCERHGPHIQIDHLTEWGHGGHTKPDNGGHPCGHHNRTKHTNHTTVTRDHTGWHYHRPDGTEIAPRTKPPPPPEPDD